MQIEFRLIEGFPGYQIATDGSVWSCRYRIAEKGTKGTSGSIMIQDKYHQLSIFVAANGYPSVGLQKDNKSVQRLVHNLLLTAFKGPRPPGSQCRHLDGNPLNYNLDNLEWGTPAQNAEDARRHGTLPVGERQGRSTLKPQDVLYIRSEHAKGVASTDLARKFKVSRHAIYCVITRKSWKHI